MLAQVGRRLLFAIPTLVAIVAAAFALMYTAPGGPFTKQRQMPPEIEQRLVAEYGLDLPVSQQLGRYLTSLARGDLGPSMTYKDKSVADVIAEGAPTSAILGVSALALGLLVGVGLGVMGALRRNKAEDYLVMAIAIAGVCLPPLVIGPVAQFLFGVHLRWLPASGLHRDEYSVAVLVLPVLALSLPLIALISRSMRASMIEALRLPAIRTARAKGMPEAQVILRHALPIALAPIVSYAGPALAGVMAGSIVIETVFQLPGVGRQFIIAAGQHDYTVIMGVVLVYSLLVVALNLAADMMRGALDPTTGAA